MLETAVPGPAEVKPATATAVTSLARTLFSAEAGIFLAVFLVLMIGGRSRFFRDPGTFWHVVVGERILEKGEFLDYDPFSYTFGGQRWTPYEWLGECAMALIHRIDGFDSLLLATCAGLAAMFTWIAMRLMRAGLHWSVTSLLLTLLVATSASHFHVRPHLFTIGFLAMTFSLVVDWEAGRIPLGRLLWLIPLFIIWTNIHGGMLGGLGTVGLAVAGWLAWPLVGLKSPFHDGTAAFRRPVAILVLLVLVCALTALANPYGFDLPRTWYAIMRMPLLPQIIQEHARMDPTGIDGILVLVLAAVYLLALLGVRPREMRVTWLVPLAWLVLTVTRIRHAPLFAVTAGLALADFLPHTRWAQWLARSGSDLFRILPVNAPKQPRFLTLGGPLAVIAIALILQAQRVPAPVIGHDWAQLDPKTWPVDLLPDLRRTVAERPRDRVFNEYAYGGFLIYYAPKLPVYVDDRCEVYGDQWLYEMVQAGGGDATEHLEERQRRYGRFDLALTQKDSGFDRYFRNAAGWSVLAETPTATLHRRTNP